MEASVELALCRRLLMMADDELILAHRNSEWAGHAPILEEDIAFANIAQDEMGHASIWYRLLSDITGDSADKLVFFRDAAEYRNCQLVELPKGDWARTIVRQYLFDAFELVRTTLLFDSHYKQLVEAAGKIRPEELYHYRHTSNWIKRLGLGTQESNVRTQKALEYLWPFTKQLFTPIDGEDPSVNAGLFPENSIIESKWLDIVKPFLGESGLKVPDNYQPVEVDRVEHSPHLNALLIEMQEVARLDPDAQW
jgi:ring-1,2-phenylacetyl-CoA epoxidase subunit PaaC